MFTRWQRLADIHQLQDDMSRLFGRLTDGAREFAPSSYPPLNVWEDEGSYFVEAELPGFQMDELEIHVTSDNQLSLRGERKQPELASGSWHRQERGFGSFDRLLEIPGAVDGEKVTAEFAQGVLKVTLPKKEANKARRIQVKAG